MNKKEQKNKERKIKIGPIIVKQMLKGKDISYLFVLISSILGTIHENIQRRGQWKSAVILTIYFGPLVELPNFNPRL